MYKKIISILVLTAIGCLSIGGNCTSGGSDGDDNAALVPLPDPTADSQRVAGEMEPGKIILPNGRLLTPEGNELILRNEPLVEILSGTSKPYSFFPSNVVASPDGAYLVVPCSGRGDRQHLHSIKVPEFTVADTVTYDRPKGFYFGISIMNAPPALSAYDWIVLCAGGHRQGEEDGQAAKGRIYVLGMHASNGNIVDIGEIKLAPGVFINDFIIVPDASDPNLAIIYASYALTSKVASIKVDFNDLNLASELHNVAVIKYPYDLQLSLDKTLLYVTNWGVRSHNDLAKVSVIDVTDADSATAATGMEVLREITVGSNPEGIAMTSDGSRIFVASSEEDNVAVINTATNFVERFISLRGSDKDPYGIKPTHLALNSDESILLVSSSGRNSLDLIDLNEFKYMGSIPVGWNPTASIELGGYWYVTNGKGRGSINTGSPVEGWESMPGSISQIPVNTDEAYLAARTMQVEFNNDRQLTYFTDAHEGLLKQIPIKHIIYILKENKTYDQIMGDYPNGDIGGDPSLCYFCCDKAYGDYCYTPNTHALADRFVNMDNFYCDSESSVTGHVWNASSNIADYGEETYLGAYRTGCRPERIGC